LYGIASTQIDAGRLMEFRAMFQRVTKGHDQSIWRDEEPTSMEILPYWGRNRSKTYKSK
jgi:hypothetical protein